MTQASRSERSVPGDGMSLHRIEISPSTHAYCISGPPECLLEGLLNLTNYILRTLNLPHLAGADACPDDGLVEVALSHSLLEPRSKVGELGLAVAVGRESGVVGRGTIEECSAVVALCIGGRARASVRRDPVKMEKKETPHRAKEHCPPGPKRRFFPSQAVCPSPARAAAQPARQPASSPVGTSPPSSSRNASPLPLLPLRGSAHAQGRLLSLDPLLQ